MREFSVRSRDSKGDLVLTVVGEVDIATIGELHRALERALRSAAPRIVVDLGEAGFMDASGAALLLRYDALTRAYGRTLVVVRGAPCIDRLLELTGVAYRLVIVDRRPVQAA